MLRIVLAACASLVLLNAVAAASSLGDLKAAINKLPAASGYAWTCITQNPGLPLIAPVEGKTEKNGYTMILMTDAPYTMLAFENGGHYAMKVQDEAYWRSGEQMRSVGGAGAARIGVLLRRMYEEPPPPQAALRVAGDVDHLNQTGDGFEGAFSTEGAREVIANWRRYDPKKVQFSDARGNVRFTLKSGVLMGYQYHVSGTVTSNGSTRQINRTVSVHFSDVGSTKVDVPEEARKVIAHPATRP